MPTINVNALYKITYGIYIVSSAYEGEESGFISNTVMQITSSPVQMAICSNKTNLTSELISKSKKVALSALDIAASPELISKFGYKSGRETDKFKGTKFFRDKNNIPVVTENTMAWFEGTVIAEHDMGSHILFIVSIDGMDIVEADAQPMTYDYYRNILKLKSPKSAPTYINHTEKKEEKMNNEIWVCNVCGYEYDPAKGDPDSGIAPGTKFEDIPDDWTCPLCGVDKSNFSKK